MFCCSAKDLFNVLLLRVIPSLFWGVCYSVGQVAAVVFTEDLKRIYVTMKEGFPLEYVVSRPSTFSTITYEFHLPSYSECL